MLAHRNWNRHPLDKQHHCSHLLGATKATQDAVTNADKYFRSDERAWLEVDSAQLILHETPASWTGGKLFGISVHLKNFGKTSARNVAVWDNTRGENNGSTTEALIEDDFLKHLLPRPFPQVVAPNSVPLAQMSGALQTPYWFGGHLVLSDYVGRIEYDDIFGMHHWTTFCYQLLKDKTLSACQWGNNDDQQSP
jgi:hypothetical protein